MKILHFVASVLFIFFFFPGILLIGALSDTTWTNLVYFICALLLPLLFKFTHNCKCRGLQLTYAVFVVICSGAAILSQVSFQVYAFVQNTTTEANNCTEEQKILKHIGIRRVSHLSVQTGLRVIVPDVAIFINSVCLLVLLIRNKASYNFPIEKTMHQYLSNKFHPIIWQFLTMVLCGFAAAVHPSSMSVLYFLSYLGLGSVWAFRGPFRTLYYYVRYLVLINASVHTLLIYCYQFQYVSEIWEPANIYSRLLMKIFNFLELFGVTEIVKPKCPPPSRELAKDNELLTQVLLSFFVAFFLHYVVALQIGVSRKTTTRSFNITLPFTIPGNKLEKLRTNLGIKGHSPWFIFQYFGSQISFVVALLAMMVWAITVPSWVNFVLLVLACVVWLTPNSRKVSLYISPILVIYCTTIIIIQFLLGFQFSVEEIGEPTILVSSMVGVKKYTVNVWHTLVQQMGCLAAFWLSLRHLIWYYKHSDTDIVISIELLGPAIERVRLFLCKYNIFLTIVLLVVLAVRDKVVIIRIIYMILICLFLIAFVTVNSLWRRLLKAYFLLVLVYSLLSLWLVYSYQLDEFSRYLQNSTLFTPDVLDSIGLERSSYTALWTSLFSLILILFHVKFFHSDFMKITDPHRKARLDRVFLQKLHSRSSINVSILPSSKSRNKSPTFVDTALNVITKPRPWLMKFLSFVHNTYNKAWVIFWLLARVHAFKLVIIMTAYVVSTEVTAIHAVYVVVTLIMTPFPRLHRIQCSLMVVCCSLSILTQMIVQLPPLRPQLFGLRANVNDSCANTTISDDILDYQAFFGVFAVGLGTERENTVAGNIMDECLILGAIAFWKTARLWYEQRFQVPAHVTGNPQKVFMNVNEAYLKDADFVYFVKFMCNFAFYKLGVDICLIAILIKSCLFSYGIKDVTSVTAVVYLLMLSTCCFLKRRVLAVIWPVWLWLLTIFTLTNYLYLLQKKFPFCNTEMFTIFDDESIFSNLYLIAPSLPSTLDFIIILMICYQNRVFAFENNPRDEEKFGCSNGELYQSVKDRFCPCANNFCRKSPLIQYVWHAITHHLFWVCLFLLFATATLSFSPYFLIIALIICRDELRLFIQPHVKLIRVWNFVILFALTSLFVLFCSQMTFCMLVGEHRPDMALRCSKFSKFCIIDKLGTMLSGMECPIDNQLCALYFALTLVDREKFNKYMIAYVVLISCLMIQRRIFCTHFFRQHIVYDLLVQDSLGPRGADVINKLQIEKVYHYQQRYIQELFQSRFRITHIKLRERNIREKRYQRHKKQQELIYRHSLKDNNDDLADLTIGKYPRLTDQKLCKYCLKESEDPETGTPQLNYLDGNLCKHCFEDPNDHNSIVRHATADMFHDEVLDIWDESTDVNFIGLYTYWALTKWMYPSEIAQKVAHYRIVEELVRLAAYKLRNLLKQKRRPLYKSGLNMQRLSGEYLPDANDANKFHYSFALNAPPGSTPFTTRNSASGARESQDSEFRSSQVSQVSNMGLEQRGCCDRLASFGARMANIYRCRMDELCKRLENEAAAYWIALRTMERESKKVKAIFYKSDNDVKAPKNVVGESDLKAEKPAMSNTSFSTKWRTGRFLTALRDVYFARHDFFCYGVMLCSTIINNDFLSMVYPFFVFCWGTLCHPRPSKRFWSSVISYSKWCILFKYTLTFLINFHITVGGEAKPVLDLEQYVGKDILHLIGNTNIVPDVLVLLVCLHQRQLLRQHGMWKDSRELMKQIDQADVHKVSRLVVSSATPRLSLYDFISRSLGNMATKKSSSFNAQTDKIDVGNASSRLKSALTNRRASERRSQSHRVQLVSNDTPVESPRNENNSARRKPSFALNLLSQSYRGSASRFTGRFSVPTSFRRSQASARSARPTEFDFWRSLISNNSFVVFYDQMKDRRFGRPKDNYSAMFILDLVVLIVVIFFYEAITLQRADFLTSTSAALVDSRIEIGQLTLFTIQLFMMITHRGIVTLKSTFAFFIFHWAQLIGWLSYCFLIAPYSTSRPFSQNTGLMILFLMRLLYLTFSSDQLKHGFPQTINQFFLFQTPNLFNYIVFTIYRNIPFLYEIRTLMDYLLTKTTLCMTHWIFFADVHCLVYTNRCWRAYEKGRGYQARGIPVQTWLAPVCGTLWLIILFILIMWLPLLVFGLITQFALVSNMPSHVQVDLAFENYAPFATIVSPPNGSRFLTRDEFDILQNNLPINQRFVHEDVAMFSLNGISVKSWEVNLFSFSKIAAELRDYKLQFLTITFKVFFAYGNSDKTWSKTVKRPLTRGEQDLFRYKLTAAILDHSKDVNITICGLFPRCIMIGDPTAKTQLSTVEDLNKKVLARTCTNLTLLRQPEIDYRHKSIEDALLGNVDQHEASADHMPAYEAGVIMRAIRRRNKSSTVTSYHPFTSYADSLDFLRPRSFAVKDLNERTVLSPIITEPSTYGQFPVRFIAMSQKKVPEQVFLLVRWITSQGIKGIYIALVYFLASTFRSSIFQQRYMLIKYIEMPYVERIWNLLSEIYMVRAYGDWRLEEELFAKLLFLFRSPETLVKATRLRKAVHV